MRTGSPGFSGAFSRRQPPSSQLLGERAGKPTLRLVVSESPTAKNAADDEEPLAEVGGVNVRARQCVDGRDRAQLERLCRYITRPPLSQERLRRRADGRLELELK